MRERAALTGVTADVATDAATRFAAQAADGGSHEFLEFLEPASEVPT